MVSAVVIHFQTPDLLTTAVESFRAFYPDVDLLIVDNGSKDGSGDMVRRLVRRWPRATRAEFLERNIYHGPALHHALQLVDGEYVFVFDSDTVVERGGFIELMAERLDSDPATYAVGRVDHANKRGFLAAHGVPFPRTAYMMIRRSQYLQLQPFHHHGQPTLANFAAARERGLRVESFPIESYVRHIGRGTASRFGYGLGLRGKLDYLLNKLGL